MFAKRCAKRANSRALLCEDIKKLPGIGDYTAGAIASIAFGEAVPAIDGNVKRVASRLFGIRENINQPSVIRSIRDILTYSIPDGRASAFNQALMELGATVCIPRTPRCDTCPLSAHCDACAAGDAESLPVIDQKKPPGPFRSRYACSPMEIRMLVFKRKERLLHGLYVFGLAEGDYGAERSAVILGGARIENTLCRGFGRRAARVHPPRVGNDRRAFSNSRRNLANPFYAQTTRCWPIRNKSKRCPFPPP